jgi:carotenoid cleavage dioxygenase-like enzyme
VITYELGEIEQTPTVLYDLKVANSDKLMAWMHDLAVSTNYIALVEQPLFYSLKVQPFCLPLLLSFSS